MRPVAVQVSLFSSLRTHTEQMHVPISGLPEATLVPADNTGHVAIGSMYHPVVRFLAPPACSFGALRVPAAVAMQWGVDMMTGAAAIAATIVCLGLGQPRLGLAYLEEHITHVLLFTGVMTQAAILGATVGFWMWALPQTMP